MNDTRSWLVESPPEPPETTPQACSERASDVESRPAIARLVTALAAVDDRFKHISIVYPGVDPIAPAVATSLLAAAMAGAQLAADQGAVWEAMRTGLPVVVATADLERRSPRMRLVAGSLGVHAQLALPLAAGTRAIGALSLYLTDETRLCAAVREVVEAVALQASVVLTEEQRIGELEAAMQTRQNVARACDIIMARFTLTDRDAFAVLRQASQNRNVKMRDLALEVITTGTLAELEGIR